MLNALTVCPTVFPIFASEPQTVEFGYVSRYTTRDSYDEIDPQEFNVIRPKIYTFQSVTLDVATSQKDFVSLLCSGCLPFSYPEKYLDRNGDTGVIIPVRFEGRVAYTCQGSAYERSNINFYLSNRFIPIDEGGIDN